MIRGTIMERISFQRIDRLSLISIPRNSLATLGQDARACTFDNHFDNQFVECIKKCVSEVFYL